MVRVYINDVAIAKPDISKSITGRDLAIKHNAKAEATSNSDAVYLQIGTTTLNPLIAALTESFAKHIPVILTPDLIFNTILQGISQHVSINPAKYRSVFVTHTGKKHLVVRDDSLVRRNWNNNWERVIIHFRQQILADICSEQAKAKAVLSTSFSTSDSAAVVSHTLTFMDIVKEYYQYTVLTMCGIPYIDLTGTVDDWIKLRDTVLPLIQQLDFPLWYQQLADTLQLFISAFSTDTRLEERYGGIKYTIIRDRLALVV